MIHRDALLLLALILCSCHIQCCCELQRRKGIGPKRIRRYNSSKMSMANVTCYIFNQPLDHFSTSTHDTIPQRYCIYDGYERLSQAEEPPIFFYTGNESPIEEYVNNTGLVWELAAKPSFGALVVFAEHRFQGESKPLYGRLTSGGCFTYLTTTQALQDFASLISYLNPDHRRPVITFGGSYGGMLSSWMRMKYPGMIAGAISSSAPVWGFPFTLEGNVTTNMKSDSPNDGTLDSAFHVVSEGIKVNVPGSNRQVVGNYCFDNLLAVWPLIHSYGRTATGRRILSNEFSLCNPLDTLEDSKKLIEWAQSPWFDLAEANYPYKSSYVPYALGEGDYDLPAWPLHEACVGESGLNKDFGISFEGSKEHVLYNVTYPSGLKLNVDWDQVNVLQNANVGMDFGDLNLFRSVKNAVGLWFNITQKLECFDVVPAINDNVLVSVNTHEQNLRYSSTSRKQEAINEESIDQICTQKIENETIWTSLVCNENLNLIMTYARGVGRDFFWPPSHPKHQVTYRDTLSNWTVVEQNFEIICSDPNEMFGYPKKDAIDPFSKFFDDVYGGKRIGSHSNIIFSNGLLDPWSAAGVYSSRDNKFGVDEDLCVKQGFGDEIIEYPCSMVQNITKSGGILAVILDLGGHHLDLMFSSDEDPPCATIARKIEELTIIEWINQWTSDTQYEGKECT